MAVGFADLAAGLSDVCGVTLQLLRCGHKTLNHGKIPKKEDY
jgi:hypothetical protein